MNDATTAPAVRISSPYSSPASSQRLGVLGIGLVMEEVGRGARLVFRYPSSPPPHFYSSSSSSSSDDYGSSSSYRHTNTNNNDHFDDEDGRHRNNAKKSSDGRNTKSRGNGHVSQATSEKSRMNNVDGGGGDHHRDPNPPSSSSSSSSTSSSSSVVGDDGIDLFFDLPARVISKLFRPKRPLCGRPLSLRVGGTTFCCRAELFDSSSSSNSSNHHPTAVVGGVEACGGGGGGSSSGDRPLVLFSVIVALAPLGRRRLTTASTTSHNRRSEEDAASDTVAIVHRNLARLCRVFTREELRCRYVSRQSNMLLRIRREYDVRMRRKLASMKGGVVGVGDGSDGAGVGSDAAAVSKSAGGWDGVPPPGHPPPPPPAHTPPKEKGASTPPPPPPHSSSSSVSGGANAAKEIKHSKSGGSVDDEIDLPVMTRARRREYVQDLIDIMLAASPPPPPVLDYIRIDDDDFVGTIHQHGNLARELATVFHCLSSPSSSSSGSGKSPSSRSTANDGVVYINRHISVVIDSVHSDDDLSYPMPRDHLVGLTCEQYHVVRSYHALLFPASSPSDVLEGLTGELTKHETTTTSHSTYQSLRRILPHVHPHKSMHEIAWDAGLSLPCVLDAANWLVRSGACVAEMPVLLKNRYVCCDGVVPRMAMMALPFWQAFGIRSQNCTFHWGGGGVRGEFGNFDEENVDALARGRRTMREGSATRIAGSSFPCTMPLSRTGAPHIFVIVSALTTTIGRGPSTSPVLGDAIRSLSGVDARSGKYGQSSSRDDHVLRTSSSAAVNQMHVNILASRGGVGASDSSSMEEILYSMAVWLIAMKLILLEGNVVQCGGQPNAYEHSSLPGWGWRY